MALGMFDKEGFSAPVAEINTTPLVDVMLVLMVIFLVTAPMLTQAVKLELPNETATKITDRNPISISVNAEGHYYWNKQPVSAIELKARLQATAQVDAKRPIHLHADTNSAYGKISTILALAQKSGLNNIGFVTEPKP